MEILHMMGHNANWNLDLQFKNGIGSGFIFGAYSFPDGYFDKKTVAGYSMDAILPEALFDFQFYGKKESQGSGKFNTYAFHPANNNDDEATNVYMLDCIYNAVAYQEGLGLSRIIIPCPYENFRPTNLLGLIRTINKWLSSRKVAGLEYYMTIPITNHMVIDEVKMETLLTELTGMHIVFDGFYVACETKPEGRRKISVEIKYLINLTRFLKVLKNQDFKIIYAYANWDALVLFSQVDIDYISVATFENLRNFTLKRFIASVERGGPSEGWYFSEKLLNLIKAQYITLLRRNGVLDLVANEDNIFSDVILESTYEWNNMKAEVHKNYIVAVYLLFKSLAEFPVGKLRVEEMLAKIENAIAVYDALDRHDINLIDESSNYHLGVWKLFLKNKW